MSRKREHEKAIFQAFVEAEPTFAGEALVSWEQPADEREFLTFARNRPQGRCIGIELAEWLNQEEIVAAIDKERREESILKAIGGR